MSVDFRTRHDADDRPVAIGEFFSVQLPALLAQSESLIRPWLEANNPEDLSIECEGESWQLSWTNSDIAIAKGISSTGLHVRLSKDDFSGLVNDQFTPMTFFVGGTLDTPRGQLGEFLDWWLVLRAVLDQRPIHMPGAVDFKDINGGPLKLNRSFTLDDPIEEMRHFLETAGFLHIASVFTEDEMAAISADIDKYHDLYEEGDDNSWWATTADGKRRLVRLQAFENYSDITRRLLDDPRFKQLGKITGDGHTHAGLENNKIEALIKPLNVVEGISDLPWHKDCSLGRHSYECCSLTVGISVTGAGPDSGQLRVIAGSHRALMWPSLLSDPSTYGLPVLDLATQTGDITMHLSCTHHMAQAPTARERRVMYTSFRLPLVEIDSSLESRARINQVRESAYKNVSQ